MMLVHHELAITSTSEKTLTALPDSDTRLLRFGIKAAEEKQVAVPQPVNRVSLKTAWSLITNLGKKHAEGLVTRS